MNPASTEPSDLLRRVFTLTPVGRNELQNPRSGLSLPQRWLLGRLDGQSDLAALSSLPGSPAAERLPRDAAKLVNLGLALRVGEPGVPESTFEPSTGFDTLESRPPTDAMPTAAAPASLGAKAQPARSARRPATAVAAASALAVLLAGAGYYGLGGTGDDDNSAATVSAVQDAPAAAPPGPSVATAPATDPAVPPAAAPPADNQAPTESARALAAETPPVPTAVRAPAAQNVSAAVTAAARPAASAPGSSPPVPVPVSTAAAGARGGNLPAAATSASAAAPLPLAAASRPASPGTTLALAPPAAGPVPAFAPPAPPDASLQAKPAPAASLPPGLPAPAAQTAPSPVASSTEPDRGSPAAPQPLRPLAVVKPEFPPAGLGIGSRGVVVEARLVVDASGTVTQVSFPQSRISTRPFERAARQALLQWRFPAGAGDRVIEQSLSFREE